MRNPTAVHLTDLLTLETVQTRVPAGDWEEAIRIGGSLLKNVGAITEAYIDAMVDNMKTLGAYIVIAPGIAMPHARPESGVRRLGVSLITLKRPLPFGNADNDPVSIVFCLAALDEKQHLAMMAEWVRLIMDASKVQAICAADHEQEVLRAISSEQDHERPR